MAGRKTIRLSSDEDQVLRRLYRNQRIPLDQYRRRPSDLERLVDAFNLATGLGASGGEILHYMIRRRKDGVWETFDGNHKRMVSIQPDMFSPEEWAIVDRLYVEHGIGADTFIYDTIAASDFSAKVASELGRALRSDILAAAMVDRRKDDLLPRLKSEGGFEDIDEVA